MKTTIRRDQHTTEQLSRRVMSKRSLFVYRRTLLVKLIALLLFACSTTVASAQTYPVTAGLQIVPPMSTYLADMAVPGSDKLRVILLQNDLTQASYDVRLRMTVEKEGVVVMRTSPTFQARPITLYAGVPTIIGGSDLYDYLISSNIDFSGGLSRESYERTKSLNEGVYKITFTAYDYRRTEVQVSNPGSNVFFLQKNSPPIINYPVCDSRIEKKEPQMLTFSWSSRNTNAAMPGNGVEYVFSLFEIRPKNSNPDYIVRSSKPVYTATTENTTLIYGPGEPVLNDSTDYVWNVQARDKSGRDLYSNQGYSNSCVFHYYGFNPFEVNNIVKPQLFGEAVTDRSIQLHWPLATAKNYKVETYRLQYRGATKDGVEFDWITVEKDHDSSYKLMSLEPNNTYEARLQWRVQGVYGPYSDLVSITTQPLKQFQCGDGNAIPPRPTNSAPLPSAVAGNIVRIGYYDILLTNVTGGNGIFSGSGKVITPGFGVGLPVNFTDVSINTDNQVTKGEMIVPSEPIEGFISGALARQHAVDDFKAYANGIPDPATAPLPTLEAFAKTLINLPDDRIDGALALSKEEKAQVMQARDKAADAIKTLDDPKSTPEQKQDAEKQLRKALGDAKPALEKLASSLGQGVQTVVANLFKNVREFLKAYKGTEEDKQQAKDYTNQTDSITQVYLQRTDVPDSLKDGLRKAAQDAAPAWIALQNATTCSNNLVSYNHPQLHGPNTEDNLLADYSCYTKLGNVHWDWIDKFDAYGCEPIAPTTKGSSEGQLQITTEGRQVHYARNSITTYTSCEKKQSWYWHQGNMYYKTTQGWYTSKDYIQALRPIAVDFAKFLGLLTNAAQTRYGNNWTAQEKANLDNTELGKFLGTSLSENTYKHLYASAREYANEKNFAVSGQVDISPINVEDLLVLGELAKCGFTGLKLLGGMIMRESASIFEKGLVYASEYIAKREFIEGVTKIDLMGGKVSQLGGEFVNIDIQATKGINGSVTDLSKFIKPNSVEEIICSSPQADFLEQASKVMKKDAKIYINGSVKNRFFNNVVKGKVENLGFEIVSEMQPLNSRFANMKFYFTDGIKEIPQSSIFTTILIKK